MSKYAMQKKTVVILFISLFSTCIVYVIRKSPMEKCDVIGGETKCFSTRTPFDSIDTLPWDKEIPTMFSLYTRDRNGEKIALIGNESSQYISVKQTQYDRTKQAIFITHGWRGHDYQGWIIKARNRIRALTAANVITVDWRLGASKPYFQAVANCRVAGAAIAQLMKVLHDTFGTNYSNMHMIGWSLGAHVAGFAGKEIKRTGNILGRITGLDPASVGFTGVGMKSARLDKSDASFVDVIHTGCRFNDSGIGILEPIGHADFYPNYGFRQPGCRDKRSIVCDHKRAPAIFVQSILPTCSFESSPCPLSNITSRTGCAAQCTNGCAYMGFYAGNATVSPNGTFYLETNEDSPYCRV